MKEAQKYYNILLNSEELKYVCPKAVGEWEEDKSMFISYYKEMSELVKNFEGQGDNIGFDEELDTQDINEF